MKKITIALIIIISVKIHAQGDNLLNKMIMEKGVVGITAAYAIDGKKN